MSPVLEAIARSLNYAELPETWRVPDIYSFSKHKRLYDYQCSALKNAACALFRYYEGEYNWVADEAKERNDGRKRDFRSLYSPNQFSDILKYDTRRNRENDKQNEVFRILSEYIAPKGDTIAYRHLINRMCFWMATGSGKTLVMIKLIEYLHFLQRCREIPKHPILILAPSEHLLRQIRQAVDEFNYARDATIDLLALRSKDGIHQRQIGDTIPVYYHRSDNISDLQKENLTDYRTYENDGKWFILLDEAHKGTKDDSKRQAYYAVMAREGFLFNFSATFTDAEDIATTVKKYNLAEFIKEGHGKNIYLNESEYSAFKDRREEISPIERRKIVLKSLITLAYISMRVHELRDNTPWGDNLYHLPLMLTLVNSVNTDIEKERNDLWTFFETLRDIASGDIDEELFKEAKETLVGDWKNAKFLFGEEAPNLVDDGKAIKAMTVSKLREMVFLSSTKGVLQYVRSKDNKELAFQMRNADSPFALIRIGNTSKWSKSLLANYEETTTLQEKSFFAELEKKPITILMGSRSFFESWDSNRPNLINYINIGGSDAKKFVVQSVGRGVRIQPLPTKRGRLQRILTELDGDIKDTLEKQRNRVLPIETLFLFATNRQAIKTVLEGLKTEKESSFELLKGFELEQRPRIRGTDVEMPLLVPEYRKVARTIAKLPKFRMSRQTLDRIKRWFESTSDSVFIVRDRLTKPQIDNLSTMLNRQDTIEIKQEKHYDQLSFLQSRLLHHIDADAEEARGLRQISEKEGKEDIVHFRQIGVQKEHLSDMQEKIERVRTGKISDEGLPGLFKKFEQGSLSREQFDARVAGRKEVDYRDLKIKKIANHYYLPVVLGHAQADYIKHVVKEQSEIDFLSKLEEWTAINNNGEWDAWMFSKIDESLDTIYIPYFNGAFNSYSRFLPDFIFWMCKGKRYRIVFVDPKGMLHANAYYKIDGYRHLFEQSGKAKLFVYKKRLQVSTKLLMFNPEQSPLQEYRRYWTNTIADIFC